MKHMNWSRRIMACVVCGLMAASVMAVPAYRGWQTKTLPDGSTIELRQVGDEFFHYWEDATGQQYVLEETGWQKVEPLVQSEESKAKKASRRYNQQDWSKPHRGPEAINLAPRGLVILVNFSDVTFYSGNTRKDLDSMLNATNYTFNDATGSIREYYRAQSNGQYVPDFDVVGPYTLDHNRKYYGANKDNKRGEDVLAGDMIVEACKLADADGVDFTKYNNDGNEYVDFVYVVYAGAEEADSDVSESIWPHNWTLSSAAYYKNCTYDIEDRKVDGLYIENYACSGELDRGVAGSRVGIGTIAHEFGHVLGLPDYYVTDDDASNADKYYTPGAWSIMDYGSYNNEGRTPPNYSAFDKYYFGWDTPELLAKDARQNVSLTTDYSSSYQITGTTTAAAVTAAKRVWYIENRQKTGWDTYLPGHGLLVWEVQYNSTDWVNNAPNNENIGYTIVTANSIKRPYEPCIYTTTATSTSGTTFPGTGEVTSYTPATGCALTEITESSGVITFKYNGGPLKEKCTYELLGEHCTVPADGEIITNNALSLTITPESGYSLEDPTCWEVEMGKNNELEYGKGFTYNALTNEFRIEKVTDDVVILAEGKKLFDIKWYAKGEEFATTTTAGTVTLPATNPSGCGDGKVFVGWCNQSDYTDASVAPTYIKDGDVATEGAKYYAVFAENSGSGEITWEIVKDASSLKAGEVYVIACALKGATAGSLSGTYLESKTSSFATDYTTITSLGEGTIELTLGGSAGEWTFSNDGKLLGSSAAKSVGWDSGKTTWSISISAGWNATIENGSSSNGDLQYNASSPRFTTYTSAQTEVQLYHKNGGVAYSNYTTTCAPCEKKMTIAKGTATNGSFALDKEGEIETCGAAIVVGVKDIKPADGYKFKEITVSGVVGTIDQKANTVTFAKNTTGTATINVVFIEKSKYTIAFYDQGSKIDEQTIQEGEKATPPSVSAPCSAYTFVGWWTEELAASNTTKKTWVTDFTTVQNQNYYAIYSKTESEDPVLSNKYAKIKTLGELTTANYLVVGNDAKAMKGEVYNNYYLATTNVSPSNDVINSPAQTIIWKITRTTDGISFFNAKANKYAYLYQAGSYYDLGLQADEDLFTPTVSSGKWKFESNTYSGQYLSYFIYNSNTYEFAAKSSPSTSIYLYKQQEVVNSTTYYSSAVDCTATDLESIQPAGVRGQKVMIDGQLYIIYNGTMYNVQGNIVK